MAYLHITVTQDQWEDENHIDRELARAYRRTTGSRRKLTPWSWSQAGWMSDGSWSEYRTALVGARTHWSSGYPILAEATVRVIGESA